MIDGATYSVTQLPARRALRLQAKLIKHFGGSLSQFMMVSSDADSDKQKADLINAITSLSASMDEQVVESLILELMQGVRKNGVEMNERTIDMEFAGDMAGILNVCLFVLEANFENFFTMLGIGNRSTDQLPFPTDTKKIYKRA